MLAKAFFDNSAVCKIMWENVVELERLHMTIWIMRIAGSVPKATNIHPGYETLNAFPLQQWLHEGASILRVYVYCLSNSQTPFREYRQ
jgi:hypothetical protein